MRTEFVSREDAERRGATTVGEALAAEPTLQVNPEAYDYLGRPSGVQMQGLDAERVLVLEDGERVIGDVGGVVDLSELPLLDLERIEYVAGPTSSLYGSNALGGVINLVGARPRALGPSLRYRAEGRSSGELLSSASAAYRHEDDWGALDLSAHHRPGIRLDDARPDLIAPDWQAYVVGLRVGLRPARRVELRLKARWLGDRSRGQASEEVPGLGTYLVDLPQSTNRFGLRAQETLELGGGSRLDLSLARSWFLDSAKRDRRASPADELRQRRLENQSFEAALTIADGRTRTWVFGVRNEAERLSQTLERTLPDLTIEHIREVQPLVLASGALFGQLGWRLTEVLTLMPGARAEVHGRYGAVVAPRLAAAFQVSDSFSLRAALGRGFRAPTAKEFGFQFDHSALGYRVIGNPRLRPETSWGGTADATARSQGWRARLGGFANWIDQLIATDLAPEQPLPDVTDYTYLNVARARTAGMDVSVKGRLLEGIAVDAGYAYLWTRNTTSGKPLPSRPPHTLTLSTRAELPGRLAVTLRYRLTSSAFVGNFEEHDVKSPAFGLLDARLDFRAISGVELFAGVLNLADVRREPLQVGDTRPALGRQLYLGVRGEIPGEE